jgi:hypothetical protein
MSLKDSIERDSRDLQKYYENHAQKMLRSWLGAAEFTVSGPLKVKEARLSTKIEVTGEADVVISGTDKARIGFEIAFKIGDGYIYTDSFSPVKVSLLPDGKRARDRRHLLELCESRRK